MKKYAMMTVKGAVGLLPTSIKSKLKNNYKLTEFYSRSLQRSGLFYGFPSKKKRMALYNAFLKLQEDRLQEILINQQKTTQLSVIIIGHKQLEQTLASLSICSINHESIFTVTTKQPAVFGSAQIVDSIQQALTRANKSRAVLLINSGDTVCPDGLNAFLSVSETTDVCYCDTDKLNKKGQWVSPHFLPDWNPELQFSCAYVETGVVVDRKILAHLEPASSTIAGFIAEIWLRRPNTEIEHVPYTLVHRALTEGDRSEKLKDVIKIVNTYTDAELFFDDNFLINHVQWPLLTCPLVSLIIPTKNGKELVKACIDSILESTTYHNFEILLIDNGSEEPESLEYFDFLKRHPKITVLDYPGMFNYSAINNFGVHHARGEIVGLINNDIEVIKPEWLTYMVGHALRDDVGCVGAKLLYSDGRIQHGGVVLGYGGGAGHAHKYFPNNHPGYMKRLIATQNYSAVTAACLLVKKTKFEEVGGLDEENLAVAFNDVDFCLRVLETGVRNVYCAEAELYHHESVSRGTDFEPEKAARFNRELSYLKSKWKSYIAHDPAYSPNLTLKRENFSIKEPAEYRS